MAGMWLEQRENHQGSRLTFQLTSPVTCDRFDSLAKSSILWISKSLYIWHGEKSCIKMMKILIGNLKIIPKWRRIWAWFDFQLLKKLKIHFTDPY